MKAPITKTRILPTDDVQEWGTCRCCGLAVRRRADGRLRRHGRVTAVERRPVRAAVPAAFGKSPGQRPGTKRPGRGVSPQG